MLGEYRKRVIEQAADQAQTAYLDYKKIKGFNDVGYYLESYVNDGGIVTKDVTHNNVIDVSDISATLNNQVLARTGTSFVTTIPSTSYYLDFTKDGDYTWGTAHPAGTVGIDYLQVATVTTDGNGNVATITDNAEPRGGFRLKNEYGLFGYARGLINVEDHGIVGDGVTDVTEKIQTLVDTAIAQNKALYFPTGQYVVSDLTDAENTVLWGDDAKFTGGFGLPITQIGKDVPIKGYAYGTEYLVHYHEKLRKNEPIKLLASGDSTTAGVAITDPAYEIHALSKETLTKFGITNVTAINAGHSGMRTPQWRDVFLAEDLAQVPDIYILRWGLNDGAHEPIKDRLRVFSDALRQGLETLRSQFTVQQMSVILMTPNSANDPQNGRDPKWFEQIYPIIKQAARDYQCCFVDTYNFLLDSSNVVWQDDPYGDGRHVHPLNVGNAWIVDLMADTLIPETLRNYGVTNPLSSDAQKYAIDPPSSYPLGVSIYRAGTTSGFPFDGIVATFSGQDGILLQINSSYQALFREGVTIRRGMKNIGVPGSIGDDTWSEWLFIANSETPKSLTLQNSWEAFDAIHSDPEYWLDASGRVNLKGLIKGGSTTGGAVIAVLPAQYRPAKEEFLPVATSGGYGQINVTASGEIQVGTIPNNVWVSLSGVNFRADQ